MDACEKGSESIVILLLDAGADCTKLFGWVVVLRATKFILTFYIFQLVERRLTHDTADKTKLPSV